MSNLPQNLNYTIDHIGIAVKNLNISIPLFERLLNTKCYKQEAVEGENVLTAFLKTGESKIELLESMKKGSVIDKFIEKKGEGFHHIAFSVDNIYEEMKRLEEAGFELLHKEPKIGADNKLVCFLHPRTTNGILVEICAEIG